MRVKLRAGQGVFLPGQIIDLPAQEAWELINTNAAEPVEARIETAAAITNRPKGKLQWQVHDKAADSAKLSH